MPLSVCGCARQVCVSEVADVEESVWAPRYGLKGIIDASVRLRFRPLRGGGPSGRVRALRRDTFLSGPPHTPCAGEAQGHAGLLRTSHAAHSFPSALGICGAITCRRVHAQAPPPHGGIAPLEFKTGKAHQSHRAQAWPQLGLARPALRLPAAPACLHTCLQHDNAIMHVFISILFTQTKQPESIPSAALCPFDKKCDQTSALWVPPGMAAEAAVVRAPTMHACMHAGEPVPAADGGALRGGGGARPALVRQPGRPGGRAHLAIRGGGTPPWDPWLGTSALRRGADGASVWHTRIGTTHVLVQRTSVGGRW